jgi:hypothetical protein
VIDQLKLENSTGFKNSAGEAQISFRRGGNSARMIVDHDEGIRAEGDYRFKDFPRVSQSFVEGSLADRNRLDEFLLGVEQDHSEGFVVRNRISLQSSATASGVSMTSRVRSSRKATAAKRRELTSCAALSRDRKAERS